jgi:hypothetical protein
VLDPAAILAAVVLAADEALASGEVMVERPHHEQPLFCLDALGEPQQHELVNLSHRSREASATEKTQGFYTLIR